MNSIFSMEPKDVGDSRQQNVARGIPVRAQKQSATRQLENRRLGILPSGGRGLTANRLIVNG
jgi:hypothetical protein